MPLWKPGADNCSSWLGKVSTNDSCSPHNDRLTEHSCGPCGGLFVEISMEVSYYALWLYMYIHYEFFYDSNIQYHDWSTIYFICSHDRNRVGSRTDDCHIKTEIDSRSSLGSITRSSKRSLDHCDLSPLWWSWDRLVKAFGMSESSFATFKNFYFKLNMIVSAGIGDKIHAIQKSMHWAWIGEKPSKRPTNVTLDEKRAKTCLN